MTDQCFDLSEEANPEFDSAEDAGDERAKPWAAIAVTSLPAHSVVGIDAPTPKPADPTRRAWTYLEAWTFGIIGRAAWKRHAVRDADGSKRLVDAGQLLASRRYLARRFNWTESAVRVFLAKLQKAGMIALSAQPAPPTFRSQGRSQGSNVLTVCNYGKYQHGHKARSQGRSQPPAKSQPKENNKTKQPSLTLPSGRASGFDDSKMQDALAAQSVDVDECDQRPPGEDHARLAKLERLHPGAARRMARAAIAKHHERWPGNVLGELTADNAYLPYLTEPERNRWLAQASEPAAGNVVSFRRATA